MLEPGSLILENDDFKGGTKNILVLVLMKKIVALIAEKSFSV